VFALADRMNEQALHFDCGGERLLGILSRPAEGVSFSDCAVLIIVGGPQYRVGAHRQFVKLARRLAGAGHTALRFDFRGMGDSSGQPRRFDETTADISSAIDALCQHAPQARRLVLFGLCDAASAALIYLHDTQDPRVDALCLLNPWVRSEATLARTHLKHYYLHRLGERDFWRRLTRGEVGLVGLRELLLSMRLALFAGDAGAGPSTVARPAFQVAMAQAWRRFPGRILLAISGGDLTAREFLEHSSTDQHWQGLLGGKAVHRLDLPDADHTLSDPAARQRFEDSVCRWLAARPC
jgi:exosortase A-associated hydrolase 1